jgi:hypothetical protein
LKNSTHKRLSAPPLKFEEAITDILKIKPEPKPSQAEGKDTNEGEASEAQTKSMKHFVPSTIRTKYWRLFPSNSRWGRLLRFLEEFSPPRIVLWARSKR